MTAIFWLALALVIYTYAGYPLLVILLSRLKREAVLPELDTWPPISIIVPFCNEANRVAEKLATLKALDYRGDIQIIFVSDGEEDDTANRVRDCAVAGVDTIILPERSGKPTALNVAVAVARHEFVLFTDARQSLGSEAVTRLVMRMQEPNVAAVSGELVFLDKDDNARIGLYWRYEKLIRQAESRVLSVPGVTGALYIIRKQFIRPLQADALLDDFEMPLAALRAKQRVVFESGALVFDQVSEDIEKEKARKVRTLTGNFQAFFRHGWLFLPWENPIWWQFISHKVCRLCVPYWLLLLLALPLFLDGFFYPLFFIAELGFYFLAVGNARGWPLCKGGLGAIALLFCELNLAAVQAAWRYISQPVDSRWERTA